MPSPTPQPPVPDADVTSETSAAGDRDGARHAWRARRALADGVPLERVLIELGALPNQDGDPHKWKIAGVGNILVKGQRWMNVNPMTATAMREDRGHGGVALVHHAREVSWSEALRWVEGEAPDALGQVAADGETATMAPRAFEAPVPYETAWARVRAYLTGHGAGQRALPETLIDHLHAAGKVYGSHPVDGHGRIRTGEANAVFLGAAGAEVRDVTPSGFKGSAPGTDPTQPTLTVPAWPGQGVCVAALTEAAVDALSYHALCPSHAAFSSNGAGKIVAQYRIMADLLARDWTVVLAQDADSSGDLAAQRLVSLWYARARLERLGVEAEAFDAAVASGQVKIMVSPSPHLMWHGAWAPACRVASGQPGTDGQVRWIETGEVAPPTVDLWVNERLGWPCRGQVSWTVGRTAAEGLSRLLPRARSPAPWKDWNEALTSLGPLYARDWDTAARTGCAWPPLPERLAWLRRQVADVPELRTQASPDPARPRLIPPVVPGGVRPRGLRRAEEAAGPLRRP